jgi:hypothetical protein
MKQTLDMEHLYVLVVCKNGECGEVDSVVDGM